MIFSFFLFFSFKERKKAKNQVTVRTYGCISPPPSHFDTVRTVAKKTKEAKILLLFELISLSEQWVTKKNNDTNCFAIIRLTIDENVRVI